MGFNEISIFIYMQSYKKNIEDYDLNKFSLIKNKINNKLSNDCGSWATPKNFYLCRELPKTKSGKILRRLLRQFLINPNLIDISQYPTAQSKEIILNFHSIKF